MKIVHTMIRVNDLDESLKFYCDGLGMKLLKKREYPSGRFTNVFVGYGSEETDAVIELTYNWDTHAYDIGNGFGHIALGVPDVYKACDELRAKGIKIVSEPGPMKHGGQCHCLSRRSQRLQNRADDPGRVAPKSFEAIFECCH